LIRYLRVNSHGSDTAGELQLTDAISLSLLKTGFPDVPDFTQPACCSARSMLAFAAGATRQTRVSDLKEYEQREVSAEMPAARRRPPLSALYLASNCPTKGSFGGRD